MPRNNSFNRQPQERQETQVTRTSLFVHFVPLVAKTEN